MNQGSRFTVGLSRNARLLWHPAVPSVCKTPPPPWTLRPFSPTELFSPPDWLTLFLLGKGKVFFILVINQLDAQNLFYNKFNSCLYMFRAYVLIVRRSKLYYTASGIITPVGGRPVHRLCYVRFDIPHKAMFTFTSLPQITAFISYFTALNNQVCYFKFSALSSWTFCINFGISKAKLVTFDLSAIKQLHQI